MAEQLRVGMPVRYRRQQEERTGIIVGLERCPRVGDKYGTPVRVLDWAEREVAFLDLDTGDSCYGYELLHGR